MFPSLPPSPVFEIPLPANETLSRSVIVKYLGDFQDSIWKFHSDPYSFNIFSSFLQICVLGLFIYGFIRYFRSDSFNGGRNFTCFLMPLVLSYQFVVTDLYTKSLFSCILNIFSLKWFFLFVFFFSCSSLYLFKCYCSLMKTLFPGEI